MADEPISEQDLAQMFTREKESQIEEAQAESAALEVSPPEDTPDPVAPEEAAEPVDKPDPVSPVLDSEEGKQEEEAVPSEDVPQAEFLDWAERVGVSSFEDAAKKAYEQEKFIGQRTSELQAMRELAVQWEEYANSLEQRTQMAAGVSDEYVEQVLASPDPARYAQELWVAGDQAGYSKLMTTWEQLDPQTVAQVHAFLQQSVPPAAAPAPMARASTLEEVLQPQAPAAQGVDPSVVYGAFASAQVYDIHGDPIMAEVYALLPSYPHFQDALRSNNPQMAAMAAQGIVAVARARKTTVSTVRMTQAAADQAAAEEARRAAAVQGNGDSPTRTEPPKTPGMDAITEEWKRMGVLPTDT